MTKWVDLARGREIHLDLDLSEERMEKINVDDQSTPSIKLFQACDNAQLLSKKIAVEHFMGFQL